MGNNYNLLDFEYSDYSEYLEYWILKDNYKKRKILNRIKKGVIRSEKKNSIKRDLNNNLFQQYINIVSKKGNKEFTFSQFNISSEIFFLSLNENFDEFKNYKDYLSFVFLSDLVKEYNNYNFILTNTLLNLESIFDIKTKKSPKKMKRLKPFTHEIVFIPKVKRLKNVLRVFNVYSENFKNYNLWERLFWLFLSVSLDYKKSPVYKRKLYIYKKSIKFFSKNKKKSK